MKKLFFITGNKGKIVETTEKLKQYDINIIQNDLGYPEPQVDTLDEVARFGVEYCKKKVNQAFILEDAGLFIDALQGFPGVYSKYVYYTIGLPGILKLLAHEKNRLAIFRSVYAFSSPKIDPLYFTGETQGTITLKSKGSHGFGYDPIFIPDGYTKTFAEMNGIEKNMCSHRGKALEKLCDFFKKNPDILTSD